MIQRARYLTPRLHDSWAGDGESRARRLVQRLQLCSLARMNITALATIPPANVLKLAGDRHIVLGPVLGRGMAATVRCGQIRGSWGEQRLVAVKLLDCPRGLDPRVVARVTDAAERAARVHHPHVAQTFDFDLAAESPFLVTELVDGGSLEKLTNAYTRNDRQFPQDLAILVAIKVAEGLSGALSAAQLVHGNLTARDVLISWSGEVKVTDFGLYVADSGVSMVRAIDNVARVAAIAPEVAQGGLPNARSDVFSLGILLHELLLGQRFSPHTSPGDALELIREGTVHRGLMEPQLVMPLRALLRRCIEKDPSKRFAHAGEVATELKRVAVLLGIPDVPAYIANAVEEIFAEGRVRRGEDEAEEIEDHQIYEAQLVEAHPADNARSSNAPAPPAPPASVVRVRDSAPTLITATKYFESFDQ